MKNSKLILAAILSLIATQAFAERVNGYYKSNGTYVNSYERSTRDNTVTNNHSYQGNTNPNTGQVGTDRYIHDTTSPYYQGADSNGNSGHDNNNTGYNGYR
jgi:hypothetical protein